jgi:uncharacterized repeat protein (TIGR02543 family)
LTSIGDYAFYGCSGFTGTLTLPAGLTSIGTDAFAECSGLTGALTLPSGLTSIEDYAFYYCSGLTEITNLNPVPITINTNVFDGVNKFACVLKVLATSLSLYQNAAVWKDFATITGNGVAVSALANNPLYGSIIGLTNRFYTSGDTITLMATSLSATNFTHWTSKGVVVSTANPFTFTVTSDTIFVANFVPDTFPVSASANNALYGSVSGGGDYPFLELATLTATANINHGFVNWTSNGIVISTANPFTCTVTGDTNFVANFIWDTIKVTTLAATTITKTSAVFRATATPGDTTILTAKGFEYKTSTASSYTKVYLPLSAPFTDTVSILLANTTYQYRAFAVSGTTTLYGNVQTFTTSIWDTIGGMYLIEDTTDLFNLAHFVNTGNTFSGSTFLLTNDIHFANTTNNITPIGIYSATASEQRAFSGTFNGNGRLIYNMNIEQITKDYQGFFGYTKNATLLGVGLIDITVIARRYTGGMVAYAENTTIQNSYVNGGELYAVNYIGGLVGYQSPGDSSLISGCYNTCKVSGNNYVGGLVGYSDQATVRNSYVMAAITGQGADVGAIIGISDEVLYYNCFFSTAITGQTKAIGKVRKDIDDSGMDDDDMKMQSFVTILNKGVDSVWRMDYTPPINKGFPILIWQKGRYAITYYLNGGTNNAANPLTFTENDVVVLKTPTKEDYDFVGWYDNANLSGNAVSGIYAGTTGDKAFWAKWQWKSTTSDITVTTLSADNITQTKATLHGKVVYGDSAVTTAGFEYKEITEGSYTSVTATLSDSLLSYIVTGLTPNTTYQYRAFTLSNNTTLYGDVETFMTQSVGIENRTAVETSVKIYPNPVENIISILLPENTTQASFILYDIQGKQLLQQEIRKENTVSVAHLSSGMYIYNIILDGKRMTGKIVKQ